MTRAQAGAVLWMLCGCLAALAIGAIALWRMS